jgi:DNA-binding response OmpR family regulator
MTAEQRITQILADGDFSRQQKRIIRYLAKPIGRLRSLDVIADHLESLGANATPNSVSVQISKMRENPKLSLIFRTVYGQSGGIIMEFKV